MLTKRAASTTTTIAHYIISNISCSNRSRFNLSRNRPNACSNIDPFYNRSINMCDTYDAKKPTTNGELKLSDLPPIEDLQITVSAEKLVKVGRVINIVDVLVVIEAEKYMPPLDLDTVLFRKDGTPLGQIFDVFGTITGPHYSIRFTNQEQIKSKDISTELDVYFLPQPDRTITKFAFVNELRKHKGTDASWENDNEPPAGVREDSSDDET